MRKHRLATLLSLASCGLVWTGCAGSSNGRSEPGAQPELNARFKDPDIAALAGIFESESREIYTQRERIVAELGIKPGMTVADIGAGTGFLSLLFSEKAEKVDKRTVGAVPIVGDDALDVAVEALVEPCFFEFVGGK